LITKTIEGKSIEVVLLGQVPTGSLQIISPPLGEMSDVASAKSDREGEFGTKRKGQRTSEEVMAWTRVCRLLQSEVDG